MRENSPLKSFDNQEVSPTKSRATLINNKQNSPVKSTSKSPQKGIDHGFISNLQGEVNKMNKKYTEINQKYNLFQDKLKIVCLLGYY